MEESFCARICHDLFTSPDCVGAYDLQKHPMLRRFFDQGAGFWKALNLMGIRFKDDAAGGVDHCAVNDADLELKLALAFNNLTQEQKDLWGEGKPVSHPSLLTK
jgi:hypothetical protein